MLVAALAVPATGQGRVNVLSVDSSSTLDFVVRDSDDASEQVPLPDLTFPFNIEESFEAGGGTATGTLTGTTETRPDGSVSRIDLSASVSGQGVPGFRSFIRGSTGFRVEVLDGPVDVRLVGSASIVDHFWESLTQVGIGGDVNPGFGLSIEGASATFEPIEETFDHTFTTQLMRGVFFVSVRVQALVSDDDVAGNSQANLTLLFDEQENIAPVLEPIPDLSILVGRTLALDLSTRASDEDDDELTFSLDADSVAAGMAIDSTAGLFSWTPTAEQVGVSSVMATVTDDGSPPLSDSETFNINVNLGLLWDNPAGGSFGTEDNWDPQQAPEAGDTAIFAIVNDGYVVAMDQDAELAEVRVPEGTVSLDFANSDGNQLTVGGTLSVGEEPGVRGGLDVIGGQVDINGILGLGIPAESDALVTLREGAQVTVFQDLLVGNEGDAELFVIGGSSLQSLSGWVSGHAEMRAGGSWNVDNTLRVGAFQSGTVDIASGGEISAEELAIGASDGLDPSTLTVTDDGSLLETAELSVGRSSFGELIIESGGDVVIDRLILDPDADFIGNASSFVVGDQNAGGRFVVRGVDPETRAPSSLQFVGLGSSLGNEQDGEMLIENGGLVAISGNFSVGLLDSESTLTVRGQHPDSTPGDFMPSELLVTDLALGPSLGGGDLSVGGLGSTGTMVVENLGRVRSVNGRVGEVNGMGVVTLREGGSWEIEQTLEVNGLEGTRIDGASLDLGDVFGDPDFAPVLSIGTETDRHGEVRVTGGSSFLRTARKQVFIGSGGHGKLVIEEGGQMLEPFQVLVGDTSGEAGDGALIVQGFDLEAEAGDTARSNLTLLREFSEIRVATGGAMRIADGAYAEAAIVSINGSATDRPQAFVEGSGNGLPSELWAFGNLNVGSDLPDLGEAGKLTVRDGGLVVVSLDDTSSAVMEVTAQGVADFSDNGTIVVGDAGSAPQGRLLIANGGELKGDGRLVGPDPQVVGSGVDNFAGRVGPGASPGVMTIEGNFMQGAEGVLEIEIAGPEPGAGHDQLIVTGDIQLGGTLELIFIDGYAPHAGETYAAIRTDGAAVGEFAAVNLVNLEPGFEFETEQDPDGVFRMTALNDGAVRKTRVEETVLHRSATPSEEPDWVEFGFSGPTDAEYVVETRGALSVEDQWEELEVEVTTQGADHSFEVEIDPGERQRFYRLRREVSEP